MTKKIEENTVYVFSSDYDYSPVVAITSNGECLFEGDNMHSRYYSDFIEGYVIGYNKNAEDALSIIRVEYPEDDGTEAYYELLSETQRAEISEYFE